METTDRINRILRNFDFIAYEEKNRKAETHRIYCRHDLSHFLDVARAAYILNLEKRLGIDQEMIYAAGLLHDIGRWMEYETGIDHAAASKELAAGILKRCGFSEEEIGELLSAIEGHRAAKVSSPLGDLLYEADKQSRNCVSCGARISCKRFQAQEIPCLHY